MCLVLCFISVGCHIQVLKVNLKTKLMNANFNPFYIIKSEKKIQCIKSDDC